MKTLTNRIALIAAATVVLGTMAYGQTQSVLKAEIPFAFRTGAGTLAAGAYTVTTETTSGGGNVLRLYSASTGRTAITFGGPEDYRAAGSAEMVFRCADDGCALTSIRTSKGTIIYNPGHASRQDKEAAVQTVPLRSVNAD